MRLNGRYARIASSCNCKGTTWLAPVRLRSELRRERIRPEPSGDATMVNTTGISVTCLPASTAACLPTTANVTDVPLQLQLEAIRAYRPFKRMATIYNPLEPNSLQVINELRGASIKDHFQLHELQIPTGKTGLAMASSLPQLLAEVSRQAPDFLYLGPDSFIGANCKQITQLALQYRIPVFSATEVALREGKALFGLVSRYEIGRAHV